MFHYSKHPTKATEPADKTRILNAICGLTKERLDEKPDLSNPVFYIINRILACTFALAVWPSALRASSAASNSVELFTDLESSLRCDTTRTELSMKFPYDVEQPKVDAFVACLEQVVSLQRLWLDFDECKGLDSERAEEFHVRCVDFERP